VISPHYPALNRIQRSARFHCNLSGKTSLSTTQCAISLMSATGSCKAHIDFMTELGTALDSILALKPFDDSRNGHLPISELTSAVARDDQEQLTNLSAEEELKKVRKQYANVDADLARLKSEKAQMESHLEEVKDQVEDLKAQLYKGEQFVATKQIQRRQVATFSS
jgi:hypothetical protein